MGWATQATISGTSNAPATRGALPSTVVDLTERDLWSVQVLDNRDERIASVVFYYDYKSSVDAYGTFRRYVDSDSIGLSYPLNANDYTIRSRGLVSATSSGSVSNAWVNHFIAPSVGCDRKHVPLNLQYSVNADTWSQLYARTLLDRYKDPPLKFRARLKWRWNTLEVGDVVRVNYPIPGVFMDLERNASTLTNRLFEIVELHQNHEGSIDATFLGHRYVSY